MGDREATIETYNRSAKELAEYFRGIGSRVGDIDMALSLADNPINPRIVEIGCGDGRDALEITQRTDHYLGFDVSEAMIGLAKSYVPDARFEVGDAVDFAYPDNLDVVFAFASLLHLDKEEIGLVCARVAEALRPGGIFYISLKYADSYHASIKEDSFGRRLFYYYNPHEIQELAGERFETAYTKKEIKGDITWFELVLRKVEPTVK